MSLEAVINFIFVYLLVWWMVLFMVLPVGIERDKRPRKGNDKGAPKNPMLKKRVVWTSLISLVVSVIIVTALHFFPISSLYR